MRKQTTIVYDENEKMELDRGWIFKLLMHLEQIDQLVYGHTTQVDADYNPGMTKEIKNG